MRFVKNFAAALLIFFTLGGYSSSDSNNVTKLSLSHELAEFVKVTSELVNQSTKVSTEEQQEIKESIEQAMEDASEAIKKLNQVESKFTGNFAERIKEQISEALRVAKNEISLAIEVNSSTSSHSKYQPKEDPEELKQVEVIKELGYFNELIVNKGLHVELIKSGENKIEISGMKKDVDKVFFEVDGDELYISRKKSGWFNYGTNNAKIKVYFKEIESIETSSAARVISKDKIECNELELESSSASYIEIEVVAKQVEASTSSAGRVEVK